MSCQGSVKFFNTEKGFGFITPSDGTDDLFVHFTSIQKEGYKSLNEGETVWYDVHFDEVKQKTSATNVTGHGDGIPAQKGGGSKGYFKGEGGKAGGGFGGKAGGGYGGHHGDYSMGGPKGYDMGKGFFEDKGFGGGKGAYGGFDQGKGYDMGGPGGKGYPGPMYY